MREALHRQRHGQEDRAGGDELRLLPEARRSPRRSFTTLAYGKRKTIEGVTCVVTKTTGMKCTNADKHGFSLNRKGSTSF